MMPCRKKEVSDNCRRRKLRANSRNGSKYVDNKIKTSKYTLLTFLPRNLYEQFQRLANLYFFVLMILQMIPQISSVSPITTALPLFIVISLTAIKDAYDDWKRYKMDDQVNNRTTVVIREGSESEEKWHRVQVGDIIRVENNSPVAADILLISSSHPSGLVHVETSELDGETNLKERHCLEVTKVLGEDVESLSQFDGEVTCEPPNINFSKFEGELLLAGLKYALDNKAVVYRGAVLRNTERCYGLVLFAGKDTKLMQNSGETKLKRTSIDKLLNKLVVVTVVFLIMMCLTFTVAHALKEGLGIFCLLVFFSYIILLSTVVPISLYVSVEIIRYVHSMLVGWDQEMYDAQSDTRAMARGAGPEELGQVQYVFSDKTGTLTQNIMTFNKCSINGRIFVDRKFQHPDMKNQFYDRDLLAEVEDGNPQTETFFRLLSLCHTVMPQQGEDGSLTYQSQAPDENALVSAARNFGFVFTERSSSTVTIKVRGQTEVHQLLYILDFNNVRKRMSVIVKYKGQIKLYTKGADEVILIRLARGQEEVKAKTEEHLHHFATEGLRTLVLAQRELSQQQFEDWEREYYQASLALEDRDEGLDRVYELIERDLVLVGASAIEDKLQDGVPQTIANLQLAGIKLWVLTGDKLETAINIGYSCNLLNQDKMEGPFVVDGATSEEVMNQLEQHSLSIGERREKEELALVMTGESLEHALSPHLELTFLNLAERCLALICCRVTPLQKALVVELIKKHKKAVTLAVGDGANDVAMIKAADIGVGISGQEGMQAVLAADFSVAQFRFLERLLLVHGRWSYFRLCKFLRCFFFKIFAFTFCHFWYAWFSAYSAQTLFSNGFITCYNLFFTSLPVMMIAFFDQDVSPATAVKFPQLYRPGRHSLLFNWRQFALSVVQGLLSSCCVVMISIGSYMSYEDNALMTADLHLLGSQVSTILVIVVTAVIALDTSYWTILNHIASWGSLIFYFCFTLSLNWLPLGHFNYLGSAARGSLIAALSDLRFWLSWPLTVVVVVVPVMAIRSLMVAFFPTLTDKVRLQQRRSLASSSV